MTEEEELKRQVAQQLMAGLVHHELLAERRTLRKRRNAEEAQKQAQPPDDFFATEQDELMNIVTADSDEEEEAEFFPSFGMLKLPVQGHNAAPVIESAASVAQAIIEVAAAGPCSASDKQTPTPETETSIEPSAPATEQVAEADGIL